MARELTGRIIRLYSQGTIEMAGDTTTKTTVRVNEQFAERLFSMYPAATTLPQALLCAAQDGTDFREVIGDDLETFVRELVDDELEQSNTSRLRADD